MSEFQPPALLRNPHLQSLLASLRFRRPWVRRRARALEQNAREHILDCGEGVRLQGFHSPQASPDAPLIVLLHGWEGSAQSLYLLSLGALLYEQGYAVFRLNLRDHGDSHHLNPELFHSCRIDEAVGAIKAIQERFAPTFFGIAGFSLGGNFTLRIAARAPQAGIRIDQAVAVCPVLDPAVTMARLETGWFAYREYFKRKWRKSLLKKAELFPELYDFRNLKTMKTLTDITRHFVEHHSPFPDMPSYFQGYAITGEQLRDLRVNCQLLTSEDDPIIPARDLERLARPAQLQISITRFGGHCGFVENLHQPSWIDGKILEIFQQARQAADPVGGR